MVLEILDKSTELLPVMTALSWVTQCHHGLYAKFLRKHNATKFCSMGCFRGSAASSGFNIGPDEDFLTYNMPEIVITADFQEERD